MSKIAIDYKGKSIQEVTLVTDDQFNDAASKLQELILSWDHCSILPSDLLLLVMESTSDPMTQIAVLFSTAIEFENMQRFIESEFARKAIAAALEKGEEPVFPDGYESKTVSEVLGTVSGERFDELNGSILDSLKDWGKQSMTPGDLIEKIFAATDDHNERLALTVTQGIMYERIANAVEQVYICRQLSEDIGLAVEELHTFNEKEENL